MKKPKTLSQIYRLVAENDALHEEFCEEVKRRNLRSIPGACFKAGKKVGVNKYNNELKYVAAYVYENRHKPTPPPPQPQIQLQTSLF